MKKTQHSKIYKKLLSELQLARSAAGMTQQEAANHINKHAPFISKIESGERRLDVVELAILCDLYNIKLSNLLRKAGIE